MRIFIVRSLAAGALLAASALAVPAQQPAPAAPRSEREITDRARTKVVVLKMRKPGELSSSATGFVVAPRVVVTTSHAVVDSGAITVWLNGVSYAASVLSTQPEHDLALLSLRAPDLYLKPIELADNTDNLAAGSPLVIVAGPSQPRDAHGEPEDRVALPAKFGRRAVLRTPAGGVDTLLALSASVERGDSGSPVLRMSDGKVVGVLSSRELPADDGISHTAYAIPVETLKPWLDRTLTSPRPSTEEFYLFRGPRK